jgi:hypothetical protein
MARRATRFSREAALHATNGPCVELPAAWSEARRHGHQRQGGYGHRQPAQAQVGGVLTQQASQEWRRGGDQVTAALHEGQQVAGLAWVVQMILGYHQRQWEQRRRAYSRSSTPLKIGILVQSVV